MLSSFSSPCFSRSSSSGSSVFNKISSQRSTINRHFSGKASNHIVILPKSEYERIKSAAVVLSKEQRFKQQDEMMKAKLQDRQCELMNENSKKNKGTGKATEDSPLPLDDPEELEKHLALHEKLKQQRIEQEDEIKKTNEMIQEVKCLAIRENQILEKELRLKTAKKQEQELEKKLTEQQLALDRRREELEAKRKLEQKRYAEVVKQQMDEHKASKALAEKRLKDWEALEIQRKVDQFKKQQTQEKLQKMEQQQKLKDGLEECVMEKNQLKKKLKEQEIKQLETLQKQQVCKELFEASVQEEREKREKLIQARSAFISKLWSAHADGSKDLYATKTRREREELDRLWRKNEIESALKLFKEKEMLRLARETQVTEKAKEKRAAELRRKLEHTEIIEADNRALEIQKLESEQRRLERMKYMAEIQKQILDKEEKSQHLRSERLKEAMKYRRNISEHERLLQEVKTKKLQELKSLKLPDKYLKEVVRKSKIPWENLVP